MRNALYFTKIIIIQFYALKRSDNKVNRFSIAFIV
jgi:hypothetical protein